MTASLTIPISLTTSSLKSLLSVQISPELLYDPYVGWSKNAGNRIGEIERPYFPTRIRNYPRLTPGSDTGSVAVNTSRYGLNKLFRGRSQLGLCVSLAWLWLLKIVFVRTSIISDVNPHTISIDISSVPRNAHHPSPVVNIVVRAAARNTTLCGFWHR